MRRASILTLTLAALALAGCRGSLYAVDDASDAAVSDAGSTDASTADAGTADAAPTTDAGPGADAGARGDGGAGGCGDWAGPGPIRVLFVGNSQVGFWDLYDLVTRLSDSAPPECPRIVGTAFVRGGANLGQMWTDGSDAGQSLPGELASGNYDVVLITESIDLVELPGYPAAFERDAQVIVDAARAAGVTPVLYASPYIEAPDRSGFQGMADPQLAFGAAQGIRVAAGGLAWLRLWDQRPDVDLFFRDRAHPGYRGSYLSALVIYATLTGASPVGLTADHGIYCWHESRPCPPIAPDLAPIMQAVALEQHRNTGR